MSCSATALFSQPRWRIAPIKLSALKTKIGQIKFDMRLTVCISVLLSLAKSNCECRIHARCSPNMSTKQSTLRTNVSLVFSKLIISSSQNFFSGAALPVHLYQFYKFGRPFQLQPRRLPCRSRHVSVPVGSKHRGITVCIFAAEGDIGPT